MKLIIFLSLFSAFVVLTNASCASIEKETQTIKAKYCKKYWSFFVTGISGTRDQVQSDCRKHGGELLNNKAFYRSKNFAAIKAKAATHAYLFIGMSDQKKEGLFKWSTNVKHDSNRAAPYHWGAHEPNNWQGTHGEDCVQIRRDLADLNDIKCTNHYHGLCQKLNYKC